MNFGKITSKFLKNSYIKIKFHQKKFPVFFLVYNLYMHVCVEILESIGSD